MTGVFVCILQHVRSSSEGEKKLTLRNGKPVFVDGYHAATNTVLEFFGCNFHGCRKCHPYRRNKTRYCHPDRTVEEVYEASLKKVADLEASGFTVVVKWECEYRRERTALPALKTFAASFNLVTPLEPRDAFFGGRTEAITLYASAGPQETISYLDYTSLYPFINKYGLYPTGQPHIHFNPENQDIGTYFGIAKVDILAPEGLFHPVLPVRQHGKLTFPLCSACITEEVAKTMHERSNLCSHTVQQRMLRGTWVMLELQQAVAKGYRIYKIHEVFHFPPEKRRKGLFKEYVNTFLKVKQEVAGWPDGCETETQKEDYIREYQQKEGILLENVAENPGRKAIAKLLLNR